MMDKHQWIKITNGIGNATSDWLYYQELKELERRLENGDKPPEQVSLRPDPDAGEENNFTVERFHYEEK